MPIWSSSWTTAEVVEMGGFAELSSRNGRFASLLRAGGLLNDEDVRRVTHVEAAA